MRFNSQMLRLRLLASADVNRMPFESLCIDILTKEHGIISGVATCTRDSEARAENIDLKQVVYAPTDALVSMQTRCAGTGFHASLSLQKH